jgi:hypothetical protein
MILDKDGTYKPNGPSISKNFIDKLNVKDKNLLFQNFYSKSINGFVAWGNFLESIELKVCMFIEEFFRK